MSADPYQYFRLEARELLGELERGALSLDRGTLATKPVGEMLRHAHTLKGAARVVRQPEIAEHAHALEGILSPHRESEAVLEKDLLNEVFGLLDQVKACVEGIPGPPSENMAGQTPQPEQPTRIVRTDGREMDSLLDGVGAAHSVLGAMRTRLHGVESIRDLAAPELTDVISSFERTMASHLEQLDRELTELREQVERLKLVPAGSLFSDLERVARDAARAQGKRVLFEGRGGEIRLDAHVLGIAHGALAQMVRNAVVHGIEPTDERRARGKSAEGRVTLKVSRRGRRVLLTCSDDGRGIDLAAVKDAAIARGLLTDDGSSKDPSELMRLLLHGGISTSRTVTELSGRGIGLDVVRDFVSRVDGETTVETSPGAGTSVELSVPLSIGSFDTLAVESAGTQLRIPLDAVVQTDRQSCRAIDSDDQHQVFARDGRVIPFIDLAAVIGGARDEPDRRHAGPFVIVEAASGSAAVGVSRLLGVSDVVVRPLPGLVPASRVVAGTWLDSEGTPQLLLDPEGLVAMAQEASGRPSAVQPARTDHLRAPILVIDDSLTTRMLEQSILESADYRVDLASSAEEGLVKARRNPYMLFLVDVEMPGMDGFGFIRQAKSDSTLRDIPAVLVSSKSGPEDVKRGFDAGASAFVSKGEFDQVKLLDHIRQLTRT